MTEYKNMNMNKVVVKMGMTEWKDIDELLAILAKYCIAKNFYRKGNTFHDFAKEEVRVMNRYSAAKPKIHIEDGYMFLDDDGGKTGLIRLYVKGKGNPKWSFWEENGKMLFELS